MQAVKSPRWRPAEREDDVNVSFFGSFSRAELHTDSIRHKAHSVTQSAQTPVYRVSEDNGPRSQHCGKHEQRNKSLLSSMNISQQHV